MKKTFCDKCRRELETKHELIHLCEGKTYHSLDLCTDCWNEVRKFLGIPEPKGLMGGIVNRTGTTEINEWKL